MMQYVCAKLVVPTLTHTVRQIVGLREVLPVGTPVDSKGEAHERYCSQKGHGVEHAIVKPHVRVHAQLHN